MAENTTIEWCDATFNPWWGCQKVSPACDHCYAERDAKRFAPGRVLWGVGSERRTFGDKHWKAPTDWAAAEFVQCDSCGHRGKPVRVGLQREGRACARCDHECVREVRQRVFCASMADWLDLDAPISEFVRLLDLIRCTPELDWLLLSKRIGNWRKRLEEAFAIVEFPGDLSAWIAAWLRSEAPANVWLGATVVTQAEADRDVPKLLQVPARVRFLSIEPMLGPIDLTDIVVTRKVGVDHFDALHYDGDPDDDVDGGTATLDWVICGGESGPKARPMHPSWARSLRDQCAAAGVPFLFKQHGEWLPTAFCDDAMAMLQSRRTVYVKPDGSYVELGDAVDFFGGAEETAWVGKKAAGRLLDGRTHDGFPEVIHA